MTNICLRRLLCLSRTQGLDGQLNQVQSHCELIGLCTCRAELLSLTVYWLIHPILLSSPLSLLCHICCCWCQASIPIQLLHLPFVCVRVWGRERGLLSTIL